MARGVSERGSVCWLGELGHLGELGRRWGWAQPQMGDGLAQPASAFKCRTGGPADVELGRAAVELNVNGIRGCGRGCAHGRWRLQGRRSWQSDGQRNWQGNGQGNGQGNEWGGCRQRVSLRGRLCRRCTGRAGLDLSWSPPLRTGQATPAVQQVGVDAVAQGHRSHRRAGLLAFAHHLGFELGAVLAPGERLNRFGLFHGVHFKVKWTPSSANTGPPSI